MVAAIPDVRCSLSADPRGREWAPTARSPTILGTALNSARRRSVDAGSSGDESGGVTVSQESKVAPGIAKEEGGVCFDPIETDRTSQIALLFEKLENTRVRKKEAATHLNVAASSSWRCRIVFRLHCDVRSAIRSRVRKLSFQLDQSIRRFKIVVEDSRLPSKPLCS